MLTPGSTALLSYVPSSGPVRRMKVWDGSSWVAGTMKVWNGTTWVTGAPKVWNGTTWA
jgi:hypothetical protein